jgi:flagellar protein FlaG
MGTDSGRDEGKVLSPGRGGPHWRDQRGNRTPVRAFVGRPVRNLKFRRFDAVKPASRQHHVARRRLAAIPGSQGRGDTPTHSRRSIMATPAVSGVPVFPAASAAGGADYAAAARPLPSARTTATGEALPASPASGRETTAGTPPTPLEKAIALANNSLHAWSTGMRFDIDPASGRTVISITDSQTGEVLRTVPTDAVLRVAKMIVQMQEKSVDVKA